LQAEKFCRDAQQGRDIGKPLIQLGEIDRMPESRMEVLRRNLRAALDAAGMSPSELSKRIGLGKDYVGDFLGGPKAPPKKSSLRAGVIEDAERVLGKPAGSLLAGPSSEVPLRGQGEHMTENGLPIFGRPARIEIANWPSFGWMELNPSPIERTYAIEQFLRTSGAYAVYYNGRSMEPRFSAGDLLLVHPAKPIRVGCYALVMCRREDPNPPVGTVRRVKKIGHRTLTLERFTALDGGKLEYEIDRREILQIHRIVGSFES
jgi:phage repressor protein C with HTH and peptisase S24 domain